MTSSCFRGGVRPLASVLLISSIASWCLAEATAEPTGIRAEKPNAGRSVATQQGHMVAYTVTIPGSSVTFEMLPVPGGIVKVGSPASEEHRQDDEGPQFEVEVQPFWMAKCEVTWAEYKQFMNTYEVFKAFEAKQIRTVTKKNIFDTITSPTPLYEPSFTFMLGEEDEQPAVTVSQYAAKQYAKWLGAITGTFLRLPSEFEWEHACRAGTNTPYSFGTADNIDEYAWYYENSDDMYQPVGTKKPNPWGLHDMHGNVAELCLDQYSEKSYSQFAGKRVAAQDAIRWTKTIFPHVIRGGSWYDDPDTLRSAARRVTEDWREEDPNLPKSPWWFTDEPAMGVGFRLIRPLQVPEKAEQKKFWTEDSESLQFDVEDRISGGRGIRALVDKDLPAAIKKLKGE